MIRFADMKDARKIAELHIASQKKTYIGILTSQYLDSLDTNQYEVKWREHIGKKGYKTVIYEENERIFGFAAMHLVFDNEYYAILDYLHVSDGMQKRGIGTILMQEIFALVAAEKIDKLVLYYVEGNDIARQFYNKFEAQYQGSELVNGLSGTHYNNKLIIKELNRKKNRRERCFTSEYIEDYKKMICYMKGEYIIWGGGDYYNKFCQQFGDKNKPSYIFDNDVRLWGLTINGVPIVEPYKTSMPIIIACANYSDVEKDVRRLGCDKSIPFYPWHNYLCNNVKK